MNDTEPPRDVGDAALMFVDGDFTSHSGAVLPWKISTDTLTLGDWSTLAKLIATRFSFGAVVGVPRGGLLLAAALGQYVTDGRDLTLICDDVLSTGASMEEARRKVAGPSIGVVVFARGDCPEWVVPVFRLGSFWAQGELPFPGGGEG